MDRNLISRIFALLVVAVTFSPFAIAQDDAKWRVQHLKLENDDGFPVFAGGPSDRFYTFGIEVVAGKRIFAPGTESARLPVWARFAARRCSACSIYPTFSFGQQAYTPQLIESPDPQPGEHPWAGWLYGTVGATLDAPGGGRHEYRIQLGVTGDPSGVERSQDFFHRIINRPQARGWDNQLGSDVGINAYYRFRNIWRRASAGSRVHWDFGPTVEAAFGTMRTHASFGGMARIGRHAGNTLSPPVERGTDAPLWPVDFDQVRIFGFLGANVSVVGHNYFLEGSRFHDDPNTVEREDIVRELALGVSAHYKGWRLTYTIFRRSEDFVRLVGEDSSRHSYGSLTLSRAYR